MGGTRVHKTGTEVVSVGQWMLMFLVMLIPIVNIVMIFVWAFGAGTNRSKSNYAKASLIWAGIIILLYIILAVLLIGAGISLTELM